MTQLLDKAFSELSKMSVAEQNYMATIILDELLDEKKWDAAFGKSQEKLSILAEKVRSDIKEGRVRISGFSGES